MVLADLRALAGQLGVGATTGMRKGDLIAAIKERQSSPASNGAAPNGPANNGAAPNASAPPGGSPTSGAAPNGVTPSNGTPSKGVAESVTDGAGNEPPPARRRRTATRPAGSTDDGAAGSTGSGSAGVNDAPPSAPPRTGASTPAESSTDTDHGRPPMVSASEPAARENNGSDQQVERQPRRDRQGRREQGGPAAQPSSPAVAQQAPEREVTRSGTDRSGTDRSGTDRNGTDRNGTDPAPAGSNGPQGARNDRDRDEEGEGRGRRGGRRFRERRRGRDRDRGVEGGQAQNQNERDVEVRDDDVLQPVAGILDVLDNYAFVRTSGYLAGSNDVYVSMNLVRKNGLRRGDAVTGAVRVPREGEQAGSRQKFNPLVRIDTINGGDAETARKRPEFGKLTPLYPNQRLRLETTPNVLTTRVIDLVMPIGKGQRALIVSPPKAGKTSVLQAIANAIAVNNPECHLMVVLVDERPEEVTDMQRSVKGEVISSTFDRPPGDHTAVAELAIERAKRLVESGRDVVVLLDSITRLGRAYNNSSPASGRILSGGVDSTALYPPKRFLGAARNIEYGGSLTIIATAMVETGSTGDTVIFEEFKGTGNAELKLDRKIAERRVFPAVDVNPSGTRKDELLMAPDEYQVALKLRRVLSGLDSHQAIDLLIDRLRKSGSNAEFLMQVAKTAPGGPVSGHSDES